MPECCVLHGKVRIRWCGWMGDQRSMTPAFTGTITTKHSLIDESVATWGLAREFITCKDRCHPMSGMVPPNDESLQCFDDLGYTNGFCAA